MYVYLSGPMTGLPDLNFPAFAQGEEILSQDGQTVLNPTKLGEPQGWEWADFMRRDIVAMLQCNGIALLPGWEKSRGALLEYQVALSLGYRIGYINLESNTVTWIN